MSIARQRLGRAAEELVARSLAGRGWRILYRNLRVGRGELDIVALSDDLTLVFVEVKAGRAHSPVGPEHPAMAVGRRKQLQLRRLARAWLGERPALPFFHQLRFDVVGVTFADDGSPTFDHIEAGF